jgi:hypothetical protein
MTTPHSKFLNDTFLFIVCIFSLFLQLSCMFQLITSLKTTNHIWHENCTFKNLSLSLPDAREGARPSLVLYKHHLYIIWTTRNTSQNIICILHKYKKSRRRTSYIYYIDIIKQHITSHVYYVNITLYIIEHHMYTTWTPHVCYMNISKIYHRTSDVYHVNITKKHNRTSHVYYMNIIKYNIEHHMYII